MQTYNFAKNILLINGVEITGYDEGDDVITARRLNDNSAHVLSADGVMTLSLHPDRSGELVFRVNQASDINGLLSSLVTSQENVGYTAIEVQMTDLNNDDVISATEGYIPRPADVTRGLNSQSQEWRIVVEKLVMKHRGGEEI